MTGKISYKIFTFLYVCICVILVYAYYFRPDSFAVITRWPAWMWSIPGLISIVFYFKNERKTATKLLILTIIYLAVFFEDPIFIFRGVFNNSPQNCSIKVVSLNCKRENKTLYEVIPKSPDIVLVSERPDEECVKQVCNKLYGKNGDYIYGIDATIIAKGKLKKISMDNKRGTHLAAQLTLPSNKKINLICVHLTASFLRYDFYNSGFWEENRRKDKAREKDMQKVLEVISNLSDDVPLILGGDFNASSGDAIYRPLKPRLKDSFKYAGVGWSATFPNKLPILRIDQVWTNKKLRVCYAKVIKTQNSDHRMLVVGVK